MAESRKPTREEKRGLLDAVKTLERTNLFPEVPDRVKWFDIDLVGRDSDSLHFSFGGRVDAELYQFYKDIHSALIAAGVDLGQNDRFPTPDSPLLFNTETLDHSAILSVDVEKNGGFDALRDTINAYVAEHAAGETLRSGFNLGKRVSNRMGSKADERELKSAAQMFADALFTPGEFDGVTGIKAEGPYPGPYVTFSVESKRQEGGNAQRGVLTQALRDAGIASLNAEQYEGGAPELSQKLRDGAEQILTVKARNPGVVEGLSITGIRFRAYKEERALMKSVGRFESSGLFPQKPEGVKWVKANLVGQKHETLHFHFGGKDGDQVHAHYNEVRDALLEAGVVLDKHTMEHGYPIGITESGLSSSIMAIDVSANGGFQGLKEKLDAAVAKSRDGSTSFQDRLAAEQASAARGR